MANGAVPLIPSWLFAELGNGGDETLDRPLMVCEDTVLCVGVYQCGVEASDGLLTAREDRILRVPMCFDRGAPTKGKFVMDD